MEKILKLIQEGNQVQARSELLKHNVVDIADFFDTIVISYPSKRFGCRSVFIYEHRRTTTYSGDNERQRNRKYAAQYLYG